MSVAVVTFNGVVGLDDGQYTCTFAYEPPIPDDQLKRIVLDDMRRRKERGDYRGAWKAMHRFNRTIAARHTA